ncbi:hypothetical protein N658DRAFT_421565 [Parathielavia hyrcaniae]|uniref:DUF6594 domain-containing protein n=1 Tax=Parathielavia hyrcaniae TaxID=113614 RepID=A0AAN6Q4J0_9PEZI|nr:hypothetical protein N658DRAFT_421565 [Parathielavia hyrcaniae]
MNPPSEGFAAVAEWIALDADNETFIFRRFDKLAARNLLVLQARIMSLEKQLEALDTEVSLNSDMTLKDAARTWEVLVEQEAQGEQHAQQYTKLVVEIQQSLKEYHETLVLQSQISNLHRPSKRTVDAFRHWFNTPFSVLGGQSKRYLDAQDGLVALGAQADSSPVSRLLRRYWPAKKEPTRDGALHIGRFDEKRVSAVAGVITVLTATNLLVGAIFALYYFEDKALRLVMIHVFITIFAVCAALMTNARRAELFAATAAYVSTFQTVNPANSN